ncbi:MAG: hypothetical protein WDW38_009261 [Sanguina aurantia]
MGRSLVLDYTSGMKMHMPASERGKRVFYVDREDAEIGRREMLMDRFVKIKDRYLAELPVDSPLGTLLAFFSTGNKTSHTVSDRPKLNSNLTASTQDVLDSIKATARGGTGASNETPRLSREKGSLSERTRLEAEQKREEELRIVGEVESLAAEAGASKSEAEAPAPYAYPTTFVARMPLCDAFRLSQAKPEMYGVAGGEGDEEAVESASGYKRVSCLHFLIKPWKAY